MHTALNGIGQIPILARGIRFRHTKSPAGALVSGMPFRALKH